MEQDVQPKEELVNLKTLYADLEEIENVLDTSHGMLEYLVEGSASDKEKDDNPQGATVTISMLRVQISTLRRVAQNNQGLINRLTGK